jgi:hypothetical protein
MTKKLFAVQLIPQGYSAKPPEDLYISMKVRERIDLTTDINRAAWYTPKQANAIAYYYNKKNSGGDAEYKAQVINVFTHPRAIIER